MCVVLEQNAQKRKEREENIISIIQFVIEYF